MNGYQIVDFSDVEVNAGAAANATVTVPKKMVEDLSQSNKPVIIKNLHYVSDDIDAVFSGYAGRLVSAGVISQSATTPTGRVNIAVLSETQVMITLTV